jgi:7-cyano-7-deazaguanine synthase
MKPKAVILLSGGLDSITVLALAISKGYDCYALSFDYGQKHNAELIAAKQIASEFKVSEHRVVSLLDLAAIGGSALTDKTIAVPNLPQLGIPVTYVPARNTLFLAFAMAWAEVLKSNAIFIGVNAVDYSGYPDCRPEFIKAFEHMANLATKSGVEGQHLVVHAPLIESSKADIIRLGTSLGVNYAKTVSCYSADPEGRACRVCDACRLRQRGFLEANLTDPTRYQ